MSATWTQEQDDRTAFEEAMDVADVSLRRLQAQISKLRQKVTALERANTLRQRQTFASHCYAMLDGLQATVESPPVLKWRERFANTRGRRHAQQHVLEGKLRVAVELLTELGVDFDAECARRRFGS